jgi:hypothetical protein
MRDVAAENKRRGASMERRVMKLLKGNRVPFSGAGALKGDGMVYRSCGLFLVECKMSARVGPGGPAILMHFAWFTKLDREVTAMRARFGIVVFHYHGGAVDYVLIRKEYFDRYFDAPTELVFEREFTNRSTFQLSKSAVSVVGDGAAGLKTPVGDLYLMRLDRFMELLDEKYSE